MPTRALPFLEKITPSLYQLLTRYEKELSEKDYGSFIEHLAGIHAGYLRALEGVPPGAERARAIHRLMELELAKSSGIAHSCTRGCSACCHLEVEITRDEGELLALEHLRGRPMALDRLKAQASRARKDPAWASYAVPENRCAFLDESGSCGVYENRPAVCRKVLVTSPPQVCSDAEATPDSILFPLAEFVLSTAISLADNPYTSISKSVSAALERFAHLKSKSQELDVDPGPELDLHLSSDGIPAGRPRAQ